MRQSYYKKTGYILLHVLLFFICFFSSNAFGPNSSSLIGQQHNIVQSAQRTVGSNSILISRKSSSISKQLSPAPRKEMNLSSSSNTNSSKEEEDDTGNSNNELSGSFFNPVPSSKKSENGSNENNDDANQDSLASASSSLPNNGDHNAPSDPFEASMLELMRSRNKKPLASEPSTVNGVPTSKAKGRG